MCLRRVGVRPPLFLTLSVLHSAVFTVTPIAVAHARRGGGSASHAVTRSVHLSRSRSYAAFRRLLSNMQENTSHGKACGGAEAAIPFDEPLAANAALLEQLGVMDLAERRTHPFATFTTATVTNSIHTSLATAITEACRVGAACHLSSNFIFRKIAAAIKKDDGNAEWVPLMAAAVLLRHAAEAINFKSALLQRYKNGSDAVPSRHDAPAWPRSDQGELARLEWVLFEEIRRGYEILTMLPKRRKEVVEMQYNKLKENGGIQLALNLQREYMDELRGRIELAVALQDGRVAIDAIETLFTVYEIAQRLGGEEEIERVRADLTRDVCTTISAFCSSYDFTAGCALYEKLIAMMPWPKHPAFTATVSSSAQHEIKSDRHETTAMEIAERLRLLTALANCVGMDVVHFTYVRDAVVDLFSNTDVGYLPATRKISQESLCAVLRALSRVTLDPQARMSASQSFFCAIQHNSQADVFLAPEVTEALLQVASAARDGNVALLLYNQLTAPRVHREDAPANIIAILLAENDALDDFTRFLSFVGLRRRVMASSAVHLLAAKLLLQRKPSNVLYTVLEMIEEKHEVEPQRTFFLRLLVFYRDLQRQTPMDGSSVAIPRLHEHALVILEEWRETLRRTGVRTAALTTIQLLQQIRQYLVGMVALQEDASEGRMGAVSSILTCIEGMLLDFSLGWLNHCAAASRTPQYHVTSAELRRWRFGKTNETNDTCRSAVVVKTLSHAVMGPGTIATLPVEERRVLLRKAYDVLYSATKAGGKFVLGFGDFVRLCWLEDASFLPSDTNTAVSPSCGDTFNLSLDRLNSCVPPVYVTDALGETILHENLSNLLSSSSPVIQRDVCIESASADEPLRSRHCGFTEEEWLLRWLDESSVVLHMGRGVFEHQLELLLRTTSRTQGSQREEESCGKSPAVQCFVSVA
ncbi:hypothetical protein TcG_03051 [Trypanosoma cruzi]|nr:hypothetical protein TcG_03051 [Trypanosoma cruzi]